MKAQITPLSYILDTTSWLAGLLERPWSVFLDSGGRGRYDIVAVDPVVRLVTRAGETSVESSGGTHTSTRDPLVLLREQLAQYKYKSVAADLPFTGGAIGYFGYDLGRQWLGLPPHPQPDPAPELMVGIYRKAVIVDHERRRACHIGPASGSSSYWREMQMPAIKAHPVEPPAGPLDIRSNLDTEAYRQRFERVQDYLRAGDCYQVNLAQRFSSSMLADPWAVYRRLRSFSPAPFGAYMHLPGLHILCNSPERFIELRGDHVTTRPIKGTQPRSENPKRDAEFAQRLLSSAKDRAENLMIVDLLRNDLSKTCAEVRVPELFKLESFATVHHLVSTVTGRLRTDHDAIDLLRGCLPGGSVTGAPKRRAMQIIDELEPDGRGVYCGSIGYIGFDGNMDTNIAIRTLVHDAGGARFWAGGGIVAESSWQAEYAECLSKAEAMFRALTPGFVAAAAG